MAEETGLRRTVAGKSASFYVQSRDGGSVAIPKEGLTNEEVEMLESIDKDGNRVLSWHEILAVKRQETIHARDLKLMRRIAISLAVACAVLLMGIFGITWAVVELAKEMRARADGTMLTASGQVALVGNADFSVRDGVLVVRQAGADGRSLQSGSRPVLTSSFSVDRRLSSLIPDSLLGNMQRLRLQSGGLSTQVAVTAVQRALSAASRCGSVVVVTTPVGQLTIDEGTLIVSDTLRATLPGWTFVATGPLGSALPGDTVAMGTFTSFDDGYTLSCASPADTRAAAASILEGYRPLVVQPRMPGADSLAVPVADQAVCPQARSGLLPFESLLPSQEGTAPVDVTLPPGAYLLRSSAAVRTLQVPAGAELVFDDRAGLTLTAQAISVAGTLRLGSQSCPLRAGNVGITFTGGRDLSKALDVSGVVEMYGKRYAPTWTRLASTATTGTTVLQLQDAVNWEVGQRVAVITTALRDDPASQQNEVRTIVAVRDRSVTLDAPLAFGHYGGPEYQAEVALLSRSIVLQGDAASDGMMYGGSTRCQAGSTCRFSGVEAFRMGQQNVMGKYPFHLHMMGPVNGQSFFEDCSVHRSFWRAFVVHGTMDARVSRNVAFNVSGSAYYLEDGIETGNLLEYNLAAHVRLIKQLASYENPANPGDQTGVFINSETDRLVPSDATAAGFYCPNMQNRWIGNSASGGFTGYFFPQLPRVVGDSWSANQRYSPQSTVMLEFDGNTAHSSGTYWPKYSACLYVGGRLVENVFGSHNYTYQSGRPISARTSAYTRLSNFKAYACNAGAIFWGAQTEEKPQFILENYESHDVARSAFMLGKTVMIGAVISARTGNNLTANLPQSSLGFQFYDTSVQTILADVTLRNFDRRQDIGIMDMCQWDTFKPEAMFTSVALTFQNTPVPNRFRHDRRRSGASQITNMLDADGSAMAGTGWYGGPAILGSNDNATYTGSSCNRWWQISDTCVDMAQWGFWACPTDGHRQIVSVWFTRGLASKPPKIGEFQLPWDQNKVAMDGRLYHFGRTDRYLQLGYAKISQVSGICCDVGWYMVVAGGSVHNFTVWLGQMVPTGGLVLATSYPLGATFNVSRCLPACRPVQQGSSLQDVLSSPGTVYFVDLLGRLYLKLVDETNAYYEVGGARVLNSDRQGQGYRYTVSSSLWGPVPVSIPNPI